MSILDHTPKRTVCTALIRLANVPMLTCPTFPRRIPIFALFSSFRATIFLCAESRTVRRIFLLVVSLCCVLLAASRIRRFTSGFCIALAVFALIFAMVSGE